MAISGKIGGIVGAPLGNKNAVGHGCGRPEIYTEEVLVKLGNELIDWINADDEHFFVKEFAVMKGFHSEQFQDFKAKSVVFSSLYARALEIQEIKALKFGLGQKLSGPNSQILIRFLAKHHGYKERQELSSDPKAPISDLLSEIKGGNKGLVNGKG